MKPAAPVTNIGLIRHHILEGIGSAPPLQSGPLYPPLSRGPQYPVAAAIARSALKPYQGAEVRRAQLRCFDTLLKPGKRGRDAPDPAFDDKDTDLGGAALFRAAQGQSCPNSSSRIDVASLGWIGMAIAVTFLQIFVGVLRWREISAECGAPLRDQAGDALQRDRNLLQPDAALLDRRRRGAALAGRAQRRRLAGGDLFHLRRPRHRPDRACGHHRREPALELPPDHRSPRPVGAAVRRFRSPCRRRRISRCSAGCRGRG